MIIIYNYLSRIKNRKWEIAVVIINTVLYMITDAGRMLIIRIALFFGAALIWGLEKRNATKKIPLKKALLIVSVVGIALAITTASRNNTSVGFIEQMQDYFGGSIAHMNYQLDTNIEGNSYFGTVVYGGFFYYFIKLFNMFGIDIQNSNEIMTFLQSYKMLPLGDKSIYYNALVPNAYYYYYDSGIIGVIIFSCILGAFTARRENQKGRPSFFNYVMFAMSLYAVVFSPLGGIFWNFRMPTVVIIAYLLQNQLYKISDK